MSTVIKKYWREIAIVSLLLMLFIGYQANDILSSHNKVLLQRSDSAFNVVKTYVDKNGDLTNQIASYEITVDELKAFGLIKDRDIDRLKNQVGGLNNLVGYWRGQAGFKGKDTIRFIDTVRIGYNIKGIDLLDRDSIAALDTVQYKTFGWTNGFLTLNEDYYPYDNVVVLDYQYTLGGFEMTAYRKKTTRAERKANKGLKRKQLVADIKFGDSNIEVTQFTSVVIKEKPKKIKWWHWLLVGFGGGVIVDGAMN